MTIERAALLAAILMLGWAAIVLEGAERRHAHDALDGMGQARHFRGHR